MPKVSNVPVGLKTYIFHGVLFGNTEGKNAVGECPFCGKEKFSVHTETSQFRCLYCDAQGNSTTFVRKLWEESPGTPDEDFLEERKILSFETLGDWGVRESMITGEIIIPGYGPKGEICNLYRYVKNPQTGKKLLLSTPDMNHGLFIGGIWSDTKKEVYVCEGPWDGMVLYEVLTSVRETEGLYVRAGDAEHSLYKGANIIAVPGCNTFSENWNNLFGGKRVYLLYDSDHPRENPKTGQLIAPVGREGMKKVANILSGANEVPEEVHYLKWGEEGYDPERPSGFDVRDFFSQYDNLAGRVHLFPDLLKLLQPIPSDWIVGRESGKAGHVEIEPKACRDYRTVSMAWRNAMDWGDGVTGLGKALPAMLATIISTRTPGDHLWVRVISPPSTGKTTLAEGCGIARRFVVQRDTITSLTTGYQTDKEGTENLSLVEKLRDKTLIIKDGDTLNNDLNSKKIYAQLRVLYDRSIRTTYGNKMSKNHENVNTTVIICGTGAMREKDAAELGGRFLDCSIMDEIDPEKERRINRRRAYQTVQNMKIRSGKVSNHDPKILEAQRLTGGYVEYLCANAARLIDNVDISEDAIEKCICYGEFVAHMRARPSKIQDETAERELSSRLVSQHIRLAICLAAVLNRSEVDEEILKRVQQIAIDTSRGRSFTLSQELYATGDEGAQIGTILLALHEDEKKVTNLLNFLAKIKVVESFTPNFGNVPQATRWKLTRRLQDLYKEVVL